MRSNSKNPVFQSIIMLLLLAGIVFINGQVIFSEGKKLSNKNKIEVINTCINAFKTYYIYPSEMKDMENYLNKKLDQGAYDKISSLKDLTKKLREHLREILKNPHIWVDIMATIRPTVSTITDDQLRKKKANNFGFTELRILPGNIGYLRLDAFEHPKYAMDTAVAALNFLANTKAIIIDLRANHGGKGKMVRLISSYLLKPKTKLNSLYFREADKMIEAWTFSPVPGKTLFDQRLFILTSSQTASAAESFAYTMKHYQRGLIVGEKTKGASHWVETYPYPELGIYFEIPCARPINPVTKTDWERVGVKPDITVAEHKVLNVAHLEALKKLIKENQNQQIQYDLEWELATVKNKNDPMELSLNKMKEYTGLYDNRRYAILIKNNRLIWKDPEKEYPLIPLITDLFRFEDSNNYRLLIIRNNQGMVSGFQLLTRTKNDNHRIKLKITGS